jgi:hypothetical protein
MKAFASIIMLVSLPLFLTNCGGGGKEIPPDITHPVISFINNDTINIDLGDKTAALAGVIATDDVDGDITSSIQVSGELESVGFSTLRYDVSDKAGNKAATVERVVCVRSGKLAGEYSVTAVEKTSSYTPPPCTIVVIEKKNDYNGRPTELEIKGLHPVKNNVKGGFDFVNFFIGGDGQKKLKAEQVNVILNYESFYFAANIPFKSVGDGKYQLDFFTYRLDSKENDTPTKEEYDATCTKIK